MGSGSILVLENDFLIALDLQSALEDQGYRVAGPFYDVDTARKLLTLRKIDAAFLDVRICGRDMYAIADLLTQNDVPFAFVTALGKNSVRVDHKHRRVIAKPFSHAEIVAVAHEMTDKSPKNDGLAAA